jgi:DNA-binding transcriptional ArsR family regulator
MSQDSGRIDLEQMRAVAMQACTLLKTLGNADRLLLLCQLTQGEFCVSELASILGIQQPTLSQQLGVLREEGMVSTRREGKQIHYSIASKEAAAVMQVLYELFCANTSGGESDD